MHPSEWSGWPDRPALRTAMAGFGGQTLYTSRSRKKTAEQGLGARRVDLEQLLAESDVVSLHLGSEPEKPPHDRRRGDRIDEAGVDPRQYRPWLAGRLSGSRRRPRAGTARRGGLDVFEGEPQVPRSRLDAPGVVLTPHIGSATSRSA